MTKLTASAKKRKRETFDDPFGCSHQPSEAVKSPRISRRKQAFATRYDFEEEAPMSRPVAARRLLLETEPNPLISSEPNVSSKPASGFTCFLVNPKSPSVCLFIQILLRRIQVNM
ncbi:Hypothetical protein NTJ_15737 [Nesidiocoris tenuis]|uniref:Uncharacterized protein n=1 Tax=Nesidiocoris tenuis TaxID=355587 RepID=A0ABN7BF31_9HEMI|nr:Hypothetical protein NTJ_15737 [Nesidiocoris tenuis]